MLEAGANNRLSLQKLAARMNFYLPLTGYSFGVKFTTRVTGDVNRKCDGFQDSVVSITTRDFFNNFAIAH